MKSNITCDSELGIVRTEQWELFSLEEHFEFLQGIADDPDASRGMPLLMDYRQLKIPEISRDDLEGISIRFGKLIEQIKTGRIALLAQSDLQFGLGRQFQIIAEQRVPAAIEVFRDKVKAVDWLREARETLMAEDN
jgi:hypothetical protein